MINIKKQSFVKGTIILVAANAVSKILGAVFKIPITYILDEEGMAIFNSAMQIYVMVLMLIISGLPVAISKLIAEQTALKNETNVHKIVRVSEMILVILGIMGSLILFFGAEIFANIMRDTKTVFAIQAIAPAVFFVAIGVVYKSYYQGIQNMTPTAISQVIESVIKLAAGYGIAVLLIEYNVQIKSAGAILGTTVGEVIATFILMLLYLPDRHKLKKNGDTKTSMSTMTIVKKIVTVAVPLTFASGIGSILSVIDISMIRSRLQAIQFTEQTAQRLLSQYGGYTNLFDNVVNTLKMSEEGARWLYGAYSGYTLTIFYLPSGIVGALAVSILPVIAGAYAVGDIKKISYYVQLAMRIAVLIALPCSAGMFMLSEPILNLLFKNSASALMLTVISPCIMTVCLTTISTSVLQATGHIMIPFRNMLIGSALKLITIYFLIAEPQFNILGAPISTNIDYLAVSVLNIYAMGRLLNVRYNVIDVIVKPVFCTLVMGVIIWLLYVPVSAMLNSEIGGVLVVMAVGVVSYAMALFITRAIEMREIKGLFKRI